MRVSQFYLVTAILREIERQAKEQEVSDPKLNQAQLDAITAAADQVSAAFPPSEISNLSSQIL